MIIKNRLKRNFIIVIGIVAFLSFIHILFVFDYVKEEIKNFQTQLADMNVQILKERLYSDTSQLKVLATNIERQEDNFWYTEEAISMIEDFQNNTNFSKVGIASTTGTMYQVGGRNPVDISNESYYQHAVKGTVSIESLVRRIDGQDVRRLNIAIPIYDETTIIGVLIGAYDVEELNKLLPADLQNKNIRSFIVRNDGHIIINATGVAKYKNLDDIWASDNITIQERDYNIISKSVSENKNGTISYKINGDKHYLISVPVSFSDTFARVGPARWNLLMDVPANFVIEKVTDLILENMTYSMLLLGIFILLSIGFYREKNKEYTLAESMSKTDIVTGGFNRRALELEFETKANGSDNVTFLLIDLDNFKQINDRFGHLVGDKVLFRFSRMIDKVAKENDGYSGRLGGDEFLLVIPNISDRYATTLADKMISSFALTFRDYSEKYNLGMTVGIASSKTHGDDFYTLIEKADEALYIGKRNGKKCYAFAKPGEKINC